VALAVAGAPVVAELLVGFTGLDGLRATVLRLIGWALAVTATFVTVVRPLVAQLVDARLARDDVAAELAAERADRRFRARFERALSQTDAEPATLRAALRAVDELHPDTDLTLLLAVPDEPRVGWTVRLLDGQLLPARPIPDTPGCSALAANATTTTASSRSLDACAHVQDPTMEVSATCVPLRLGDRVLGVVTLLGAPGEPLDRATLQTLEWLVERTGARIAEQRRQRGPSTAGREDPVTGLPGPGTLERNLRELTRSLTPFCLSILDIDDFPDVRLQYGDTEADEALRLMADTLRLTLRPDDLVCRLEGARYGVLLGNCAAPQASAALERVREALVLAIAADEGPHFTFSAGVVESHRATSMDDLLEQARTAAKDAHANGGNRVAVAHD
jgi:diguanylate cyclase (GGDEF)-like protein